MDYSTLEPFNAGHKQRLADTMKRLGEPPSTMKIENLTYTTRDGTSLRARLYKPTSPPKTGSPLAVIYHGGGFCIGAPEGEEQTCRNLVQAFGATCLSMQYRLAPQFPFPHAVNDAWDALLWAAKNATSLGADPNTGFIIGGTSAGGNITAVLAHLARDHNLSPPLTGQYLSIPAICPPSTLPDKFKKYSFSYEQNKDAPVLPQGAIDMFMNGYQPDDNDSVNYAILNHPKGHNGLPPAYFQICGLDPLRDEALIYERVLREEYGVKTKMDIYPGLPHGFWGTFFFLKSADRFREEQVKGLGWLLGREVGKVDIDAAPAQV